MPRPRWFLAAGLFLLTFVTAMTLGAPLYLMTRTDVTTPLVPVLLPSTVNGVWSDGDLRAIGLQFSLPLLFILLCHELGHYVACRYYRLPVTLPYFIPAPLGLGTFGAFIKIKSRIRSKKELLDVGIAGPLAGFVALIPFLLYGVAHSRPSPTVLVEDERSPLVLLVPGKSLAMNLATSLFHGPLEDGVVLDLHPFALAALVGLLVTALNLLPVGQLDGGHILYSLIGRWQHRLALPLWLGLALAGILVWRSWLLWCLILLFLGLRHPPLADEGEPLDPLRKGLALLALLLLLLTFAPVPFEDIQVAVESTAHREMKLPAGMPGPTGPARTSPVRR